MAESDTDPMVAEDLLNRWRALFTLPYVDKVHLVNELKGLVTNLNWRLPEVIDLFDALLKRFESAPEDTSHFTSWMMNILRCIVIHFITPSWRCQSGKTLTELVRDTAVTDEELSGCLADEREKTLDEILEEIRLQKSNQIDENLLNDVRDIVSSVHEALTSEKDGSQLTGLKEVLLKLCKAVEEIHFRPRLTQMVSWSVMVLSKTGRLIQVGTGEGKSCIVAMFAAFRAMRGEHVDIMSSSSVLAERDLKEWEKFYKLLKISVDCNTNKQGERLKQCYERRVVYGTAEQFGGDWLCQHFGRMDILGKRKSQCAIVDEVDSMMLDKGQHVVYISSETPALQHLNPLLVFIWATVNQYSQIGTEVTVGQKKHPFHQVVLDTLKKEKGVDESTILQLAEDTGVLAKGSVRDLKKNPSLLSQKTATVTAGKLAEFFKAVERKFPSCHFALHYVNNDDTLEVLDIGLHPYAGVQTVPLLLTHGGFCHYMYFDKESVERAVEEEIKHALHFTPCELSGDNFCCYVPGFLSHLINCKLRNWIANAFYAQIMAEDHEYVIETHGVVPVDFSSTGVVQNSMTLVDGLQQFLEMKHMSKLSDMQAITNYVSNVELFLKYGDQIFGISGTLGQQAETEALQKIYEGIQMCQIPLFKRRKLFEVEGVVVDNEKEWIKKICSVVTDQTNPTQYGAQRAVLVICETIRRAKVLYNALGDKVPNKKLYISNNMDNSAVLNKNLEAGEVIIATNLAGRGTDLKVSESVNGAGGLFVAQTYLPKNARVEAQAFGRTARQGSPGSAQLIVCLSHLNPLYQECLAGQLRSEITTVKKIRDVLEASQLASYLASDIPKIKKKEELFREYLGILDEVYKSSSNNPKDSYVSALNEVWGMWLLTDFNENDSIADSKTKLTEHLKSAGQKLGHRESPTSNFHPLIAFGNDSRKKGDLAESIKMYTKAIQQDSCWAAVAYYNRAFASLTQQNTKQDPACINGALEDLRNALRSVVLCCDQIEIMRRHMSQINNLCQDSITRFDHQMIVRKEVLLCFKANITEAIQKVDRAGDLGGYVKVEDSLVCFLVPIMRLIHAAVISNGLLPALRSRDPIKFLQLISEPSFDILTEVSRMESLGLTHVYKLDTLFTLGGFFTKIHRTIVRALD